MGAAVGAGIGKAAAAPGNPFGGTELDLKHLSAILCTSTPSRTAPVVELRYAGPIQEVIGPLCYHYAGYNETCLPVAKRWFTPATRLTLAAPGQVPGELLQNYTLLLRFPWQQQDNIALPLTPGRCDH